LDVAAIVPAAGQGRRFKTKRSKLLVPIGGKPLLAHTLSNLRRSYPFKEIIILTKKDDVSRLRSLLSRYGLSGVRVEEGGRTRAESVRCGVRAMKSAARWVLVHDAARPLVSKKLVRRTLDAARATGAALCAMPATATVKRTAGKVPTVVATEDRSALWLAQTPQVFRRSALEARYLALGRKALQATDEAALFDGSRTRVRVVEGELSNIKVTTPGDLAWLRFHGKAGVQ
jgi:2-C-methyl-D-erythritol 4-phosphate cytidylyltransferase